MRTSSFSEKGAPHLGSPEDGEKIKRRHRQITLVAISTVHAVLDRHGLVTRGRNRLYKAQGTTLSTPTQANDLWCADYKGEFMLADKRYCYPLTISDFASRYLICCEALATTKAVYAFTAFERLYGLWTPSGHPHRQRHPFSPAAAHSSA